MKKFTSVLLALLMVFALVPFTAMAAVADDDVVAESLKSEESYYHLEYVRGKKYFETETAVYTAFSLYDNAWNNFFTGSVDTANAKTVLLGLIERFDAEYQNEEVEEIIKVLEAASSAADVIEKVNEYTGWLDFAESAEWSSAISYLNTGIKVLNKGNELYEKFVEGYAVILSCRAASLQYGEFLAFLAENCADDDVCAAATELKANIDQSMEDAIADLVAELADAEAAGLVEVGVNAAMDFNGVTAIIKKVYNIGGSVADKVFSTSDKYTYMSTLAVTVAIEDCMDAYFATVTEETRDFALLALLTIRKTGENMLLGLGKVTEDSIAAKLFKGYDTTEIKERAGIQIAKLSVLEELLTAEENYDVKSVVTCYGPATASFGAVEIPDCEVALTIGEDAAYASVYVEELNTYVKVIAAFKAFDVTFGCSVSAGNIDVSVENTAGGYDASYMQNKYVCTGATTRTITITGITLMIPQYIISDSKYGTMTAKSLNTVFASANSDVEDTQAPVEEQTGTDEGTGSSDKGKDTGKLNFGDLIKQIFENLIQSILDAFKNIF